MIHNQKIVAITQARTGSTRLPNKVLMEVGGKSFLEIHLERISRSTLIDEVVVATTSKESDDVIASVCSKLGYTIFRGSEDDVLDRYYRAAQNANADVIVRITSDCPLVDPALVDRIISEHVDLKNDFTSNIVFRTFPDGFDVEVFNFEVLEKAWKEATLPSDREHVTYYIWRNSNLLDGELFTSFNVVVLNDQNYGQLRLTLDYPEDKELLEKLIQLVGTDKSWEYYVDTLLSNPQLIEINRMLT